MDHNKDSSPQPLNDPTKATNEIHISPSRTEETLVSTTANNTTEAADIFNEEVSFAPINSDSLGLEQGETSAQEDSSRLRSLKAWSFPRNRGVNYNQPSASQSETPKEPPREGVQSLQEFLRSMPSRHSSLPRLLTLDPQPHIKAKAKSSFSISSLRDCLAINAVPSMYDWSHPCNYVMPSKQLLHVYFVSHVALAIDKSTFRHLHPEECFCHHVLRALEEVMSLGNLRWCPPNHTELMFILEGIFTARALDDFKRSLRAVSQKHGYKRAAKKYISKRSIGSWVSQFVETLVKPPINLLQDFTPGREELSNPRVAMAHRIAPPGSAEEQRG